MKQVLIRRGKVVVEQVPEPVVEPGTVLVRVDHSCISVGTELSGVQDSGAPLWKKALQRPAAVLKAAEMAATQGLDRTRSHIQGKLSAGQATGYSAAGTVVEVGPGIDDLRIGDRVACAGAQCAHHAEYIRPPRNLVVRIPDGLDFASASTVTVGAIALQGVRRAAPTLGETFVVIGLGVLGQLVIQLLKANGCRVIATDLDADRIATAQALGADVGLNADVDSDVDQVVRLTDGLGADGVIVTAATKSDAVISTAFRMCRKKGRVVVVGDVGLHLNRADIYTKELDFFISTSYGPGRYDQSYEEQGIDYPVGYVRWTENRNMAEYLRLVSERKVNLAPLVGATYDIANAGAAYAALSADAPGERPLIVLLSYPQPSAPPSLSRRVANPHASPRRHGVVRTAIVGAGSFAKSMHLPLLQSLHRLFRIEAVVSRSGHNATAVATQFGASYATTDYQTVLDDPDIDAVLIATRHDQHASMALKGLQAGKHVFLEKPLALTAAELERISQFYQSPADATDVPILLTGFNRRFSPHVARLKEQIRNRSNPLMINYRMNAGYIPLDAWYHGPQGGGRNRGEACHIYDLFVALTGSTAVDVVARTIRPQTAHYSPSDNFTATVAFADGSLATLTYTALGSRMFPKETMEIFVDGRVLVLDDYRATRTYESGTRERTSKLIEKGHREELQAFGEAIRSGGPWPIPLEEQIEATRIAFEVERFLVGTIASTTSVPEPSRDSFRKSA